jgi:hypothetical protein
MTASLRPAGVAASGLQRLVSGLMVGDRVRVTFHDGTVVEGALRKSGLSVLDEGYDNILYLDVFPYDTVRNVSGLLDRRVADIERWDTDDRFDACMVAAQEWCQLEDAARHCPKSEMDWRQALADEAKTVFIATWMGGQS